MGEEFLREIPLVGRGRYSTGAFRQCGGSSKILLLVALLFVLFLIDPTERTMNDRTIPVVELEAKDLPAHCPNPAMPLWSSHPRVFLDFDPQGNAKCPYCGTQYHAKGGMPHH
jgi:uncharacterized Zn-finger protein